MCAVCAVCWYINSIYSPKITVIGPRAALVRRFRDTQFEYGNRFVWTGWSTRRTHHSHSDIETFYFYFSFIRALDLSHTHTHTVTGSDWSAADDNFLPSVRGRWCCCCCCHSFSSYLLALSSFGITKRKVKCRLGEIRSRMEQTMHDIIIDDGVQTTAPTFGCTKCAHPL